MYALVQYEDRNFNDYKYLIKQNKKYAKYHSIDHIFLKSGYDEYPPWWRKVFLVKELLKKYEAIIWVDSDAAIVGPYHFKDLLDDKHFVLSPNPPMLDSESLSMFSAPFCAGIWAVKNSPEGFTIMDRWSSLYNKDFWQKTDNNWKHKKGIYGGIAYEQGSFEMGVWRYDNYFKFLLNLPSRILNYLPRKNEFVKGFQCPKDVFAVHYWKGNRGHISQHFN